MSSAPDPVNESDAVRFLQRATFGGRPSDVAALQSTGIDAWIDDHLGRTPAETNVGRLLRSRAELTYTATSFVLWEGLLDGDDELRKRVSYALSQIFVIAHDQVTVDSAIAFADLLESNAFGNYRDLLEDVTLSIAMSVYLTYFFSVKADPVTGRQPDENYAREILQLFSIGLWELNIDGTRKLVNGEPVPTYDQDDIAGLARVFTGWRGDSSTASLAEQLRSPLVPFTNEEQFHEPGEKRFLGAFIPARSTAAEFDGMTRADLKVALDLIADHPNVGPFIGRQLIQRLVTANPSPAYIERVATVFNDDGTGTRGNLGAVVRAILTDEDAWASNRGPEFGKLREPVLRFTTTLRALDVTCTSPLWRVPSTEHPTRALGQMPYLAPSVFNFYRPGYVPPQSALADNDLVGPEFQIANESANIGWVNFMNYFLRTPPTYIDTDAAGSPRIGIQFDWQPLRDLADDPAALVDAVADRLCPDGLANEVRSIAIAAVTGTTHPTPDIQDAERARAAVMCVIVSTDFLHER